MKPLPHKRLKQSVGPFMRNLTKSIENLGPFTRKKWDRLCVDNFYIYRVIHTLEYGSVIASLTIHFCASQHSRCKYTILFSMP